MLRNPTASPEAPCLKKTTSTEARFHLADKAPKPERTKRTSERGGGQRKDKRQGQRQQ